MWFVIWAVVSAAMAFTMIRPMGWLPALAFFVGSILAVFGGSGLKGSLLVGTPGQKVAGLGAGLAFLAVGAGLVYWSNVHPQIFGLHIPKSAWGVLGFAIGFQFTTRSDAEG